MSTVCKDNCAHSPDNSSNRVRAPAIAAVGIGLGALESIASARLRSIDEGGGPVLDSPTSGDPSRGGYKNCPDGAIISYEEEPSIARGEEEQLDKKMDVKDMELDMKTSHGRAREEREECAREEEEVQAGPSRPKATTPAPVLTRSTGAQASRAGGPHACANRMISSKPSTIARSPPGTTPVSWMARSRPVAGSRTGVRCD
ncbi:hypothetical protein QYE76_043535 [Lolium multiflorum]|uniref:Uncharacterized protein n=1 Tax=Lolium multiflorum TaxID=4521 RepID=A0AAD8TJ68_LOLMU|nr:hypothetical protein QYE76_043535 [Lolium multiflorum]